MRLVRLRKLSLFGSLGMSCCANPEGVTTPSLFLFETFLYIREIFLKRYFVATFHTPVNLRELSIPRDPFAPWSGFDMNFFFFQPLETFWYIFLYLSSWFASGFQSDTPLSRENLFHEALKTLWTRLSLKGGTGNRGMRMGNENGERGTGNGESLKWGIFKSGNL